MKLHELREGGPTTIELLPDGGAWRDPPPARETEVFLAFDEERDTAVLSWLGPDARRVARVVAEDRASRAVLANLRDDDAPRLLWLAEGPTADRTSICLRVHTFQRRLDLSAPILLVVDSRLRERLEHMRRCTLTTEAACAWLRAQVLLPGTTAATSRAVAVGAPAEGGRFRLLGRTVALDVQPDEGGLRVAAVVSRRPSREAHSFRPEEVLLEAPFEFVDERGGTEQRAALDEQLRALVQTKGSYLQLWLEYQKLERQQLWERARRVGWLPYERFEPLPSGAWRFEARDEDALRTFVEAVERDGQDGLEAAEDVPFELRGPPAGLDDVELEGPPDGRRAPTPVGVFVEAHLSRRTIDLTPVDEDSDAVPPAKGYLFPALRGDRTRLERRRQAVDRISSADAAMPQLVRILQGTDFQPRSVDHVRPISAATRAAFGRDPTPAQRTALDLALNTPDVVLIQGPPGTGKTQVIAALQARLAELEGDRPELAGRALVSCFQHDAVTHLVSRTRVRGFPPLRFGGRPGERPDQVQLQRWCEELREHVTARLSELPESRPLREYRRALEGISRYAVGRLPRPELRALLDELCALEPGAIMTDVWQRLDAARRAPRARLPEGTFAREQKRVAARGLRVTSASFADDGPRAAQVALSRCRELLTREELALLERAAASHPEAAFSEFAALDALRDALLDRLLDPTLPEERLAVDRDVLAALEDAVACLEERVRRAPAGIADALEELRDNLAQDPEEMRRTLQRYTTSWAATCQQAVSGALRRASGLLQRTTTFESVIVDEAARASPLDLLIPLSLARRRIVLVGDHRQLPHLLDPDVERALNRVDDEGQPTLREEEQRALAQSLFERLFRDLRGRGGTQRVVTLDQQFRMHPVLGQFVSDVFYAPHGEAFRSPRPASDFAHRLDGYVRGERPLCAVWKDIPLGVGAEEGGQSKRRYPEARWIADEVRRLLTSSSEPLSVGVITFYAAQVDELLQALARTGLAERDPETDELRVAEAWRTLDRDGRKEDRLRVGTVDAFQGQEFDVVFLSVVRSNRLPATDERGRRKKFGHLMVENRLCVAMSRQRRLLVAVGDRAMFQTPAAAEATPGLVRFLELCGGDHGDVR